jgi:hypothetical protein
MAATYPDMRTLIPLHDSGLLLYPRADFDVQVPRLVMNDIEEAFSSLIASLRKIADHQSCERLLKDLVNQLVKRSHSFDNFSVRIPLVLPDNPIQHDLAQHITSANDSGIDFDASLLLQHCELLEAHAQTLANHVSIRGDVWNSPSSQSTPSHCTYAES